MKREPATAISHVPCRDNTKREYHRLTSILQLILGDRHNAGRPQLVGAAFVFDHWVHGCVPADDDTSAISVNSPALIILSAEKAPEQIRALSAALVERRAPPGAAVRVVANDKKRTASCLGAFRS